MSTSDYTTLLQIGPRWGIPIYRPGQTQLQFLIRIPENLRFFCIKLHELGYYLVTMVANDERELEDHCFKIYHLFSHPTDNLFVTLEYSIRVGQETYPSITYIYPAAEVFEREIADLFGLLPEQEQPGMQYQSYMHNNYPEGVHPLRRNWSQETYQKILKGTPPVASISAGLAQTAILPEGELFLAVGPIHAGVIEPGNFLFRTSGETIEQLDILLGYTHKGVERLFQSNFSLLEGCRMAEKVSGDSSFVHSLAYCRATELLSRTRISDEAHLLRAIFLELERLVNHIGDCSALVHDLALDLPASNIAVMREQLLQLCSELTHSRFLRGVNWPGGICLPKPFEKDRVLTCVNSIVQDFLDHANMLILRSDFRERTINTGVLSTEAALRLGVTGFVARASGLPRDFRIQHPFGPYVQLETQELIKNACTLFNLPINAPDTMTGDVFSRFVQRVIEVNLANRLIHRFVDQLPDSQQTEFLEPLKMQYVPNYETGLGYAEGWRGDVVYWLMKDKFDHTFRCKVRDPSTLNWPGLKEAVAPRMSANGRRLETALVDFPVINKSFNLSYSGADL